MFKLIDLVLNCQKSLSSRYKSSFSSVEQADGDCDTTVEMEGDSDSGQNPEEDARAVHCAARDECRGQRTKENPAEGSSGEDQ